MLVQLNDGRSNRLLSNGANGKLQQMNQAEGIRYRRRIKGAVAASFILSSALGIFAKLYGLDAQLVNYANGDVAASGGALGHFGSALMIVMPITIFGSWVLHTVLSFLYLRNPGYSLKEGCYSDSSWLNLEDNQLVLLDKSALVVVNFDSDQAEAISEAYQNNSSCEDLRYIKNSDSIKRIFYSDMESLRSRKEEKSLTIVAGGETTELQFLNAGTKACALPYLKSRLPEALKASEIETSRRKTAFPQVIACAFFVVCAALTYQSAVSVVIGAPALVLLPGILETLFDPAMQGNWSVGDSNAANSEIANDTNESHAKSIDQSPVDSEGVASDETERRKAA